MDLTYNLSDNTSLGFVLEGAQYISTGGGSAAGITNVPAGTIAATNVQDAINELDTEKQAISEKGQVNGYASLDGTGKVPTAQLPASVVGALNYQGTWNAATNTPTLSDGTGTKGYYYVVSTGGSRDLGSGSLTYNVGDWVVHNGTKWDKLNDANILQAPQIDQINGITNNNRVVDFTALPSAVNYFNIQNAATGSNVLLSAKGSDTNVNLALQSQGASGLIFLDANKANYLYVQGAAAAGTPKLQVNGSDTNISFNIVPKGTGTLQVNGVVVPTVSSSDTLSNKTLSSPAFSGTPTSSGDFTINKNDARLNFNRPSGQTGQYAGIRVQDNGVNQFYFLTDFTNNKTVLWNASQLSIVEFNHTSRASQFFGQIQSTVTTGTSPFTVASTTKVTNLNADFIDGLDASDFLQKSIYDSNSDGIVDNSSALQGASLQDIKTLIRRTALIY